MNRERNLQEMLISVVIGAVISIIFCALVPYECAGFAMAVSFLVYWFVFTVGVWEVIDIADFIRGDRS